MKRTALPERLAEENNKENNDDGDYCDTEDKDASKQEQSGLKLDDEGNSMNGGSEPSGIHCKKDGTVSEDEDEGSAIVDDNEDVNGTDDPSSSDGDKDCSDDSDDDDDDTAVTNDTAALDPSLPKGGDNGEENDDESNEDENGLSAYEKLRLARIQRNQQYLAQLGLEKASSMMTQQQPKKRQRSSGGATLPPRRSSLSRRTKQEKINYAWPSSIYGESNNKNSINITSNKGGADSSNPSKPTASQPYAEGGGRDSVRKQLCEHSDGKRPPSSAGNDDDTNDNGGEAREGEKENTAERKSLPQNSRSTRMDINIHREFLRIRASKRNALKLAKKCFNKAEKEVKYWTRASQVHTRKMERLHRLQAEQAAKDEERRALGGRTMRELLQEIDRRMPTELVPAAAKYDSERRKAWAAYERQTKESLEGKRNLLLRSFDEFPKALQTARTVLSAVLVERSPKDPPPPRRSKRTVAEGDEEEDNEDASKRKKAKRGRPSGKKKSSQSSSNNDETAAETAVSSVVTETWALLPSEAMVTNPEVDGLDDSREEGEEPPSSRQDNTFKEKSKTTPKPARKAKAKSVGGWISPDLAHRLDRQWLVRNHQQHLQPQQQQNPNESNALLQGFVPQVGDAVLYYPLGHKAFLEDFPDVLGKKTRQLTRIPLWERAQDNRNFSNSKCSSDKKRSSKSAIPKKEKSDDEAHRETTVPLKDTKEVSSSWWTQEWIDAMRHCQSEEGNEGEDDEHDLGTAITVAHCPILCTVLATTPEFPPDTSKACRKQKEDGTHEIVFEPLPSSTTKKKGSTHRNKTKPTATLAKKLRLAVALRPLTPISFLDNGGFHMSIGRNTEPDQQSPSELPPSFTAVTFPSSFHRPFLIPFAWAYCTSLKLQIGDLVSFGNRSSSSRECKIVGFQSNTRGNSRASGENSRDENETLARQDTRISIGEKVRWFLAALLQQPRFGGNIKAAILADNELRHRIPPSDIAAILKNLSELRLQKENIDFNESNSDTKSAAAPVALYGTDGKTMSLWKIICSTLPLWDSVALTKSYNRDEEEMCASPWELTPVLSKRLASPSIVSGVPSGPSASSVANLVCGTNNLDESLRIKLCDALKELVRDHPSAPLFVDEVTDAVAPSYSCAIPVPMFFYRILARMGTGGGGSTNKNNSCSTPSSSSCHYRSVGALLSDVTLIRDNCLLYNNPEADVVEEALDIVAVARDAIGKVVRVHNKEMNEIRKADMERQRLVMLHCGGTGTYNPTAFSLSENHHELPQLMIESPGAATSAVVGKSAPVVCRIKSPFKQEIYHQWLQQIQPTGIQPTGNHQDCDATTTAATPWVPQAGDCILYSRKRHAKFVLGHYPSLEVAQCTVVGPPVAKGNTTSGSLSGMGIPVKDGGMGREENSKRKHNSSIDNSGKSTSTDDKRSPEKIGDKNHIHSLCGKDDQGRKSHQEDIRVETADEALDPASGVDGSQEQNEMNQSQSLGNKDIQSRKLQQEEHCPDARTVELLPINDGYNTSVKSVGRNPCHSFCENNGQSTKSQQEDELCDLPRTAALLPTSADRNSQEKNGGNNGQSTKSQQEDELCDLPRTAALLPTSADRNSQEKNGGNNGQSTKSQQEDELCDLPRTAALLPTSADRNSQEKNGGNNGQSTKSQQEDELCDQSRIAALLPTSTDGTRQEDELCDQSRIAALLPTSTDGTRQEENGEDNGQSTKSQQEDELCDQSRIAALLPTGTDGTRQEENGEDNGQSTKSQQEDELCDQPRTAALLPTGTDGNMLPTSTDGNSQEKNGEINGQKNGDMDRNRSLGVKDCEDHNSQTSAAEETGSGRASHPLALDTTGSRPSEPIEDESVPIAITDVSKGSAKGCSLDAVNSVFRPSIEHPPETDAKLQRERTNEDDWEVGVVRWTRASFPKMPSKTSSEDALTFPTTATLLAIGVHVASTGKIETIYWRPCLFQFDPIGMKSKERFHCPTCGLETSESFLRLRRHPLSLGRSPTTSLLQHEASESHESCHRLLSTLSIDENQSLHRCLSLLKRKCIRNMPPDSVDERLTKTSITEGYMPTQAKIGLKTLPDYTELLLRRESAQAAHGTRKQGQRQKLVDDQLLAQGYVPPWLEMVSQDAEDTFPRWDETISPWSSMSLELVLLRLENRYYRHREAVQNDIIEAYASICFLLLARDASRKKEPISIRRLARHISIVKLKGRSSLNAENAATPVEEDIWVAKLEQILDLYATALVCISNTRIVETLFGLVSLATTDSDAIVQGPPSEDPVRADARNKLAHLLLAFGKDLLMNRVVLDSRGGIPQRRLKVVCAGSPVCVERYYEKISRVAAEFAGKDVSVKVTLNNKEIVFLNRARCRSSAEARLLDGDSLKMRIVCDGEQVSVPSCSLGSTLAINEDRIRFEESDFEAEESLTQIFFGRPGRMKPCARCLVHRRSLLSCRVRRRHSNCDFDWMSFFVEIGTLDKLLVQLDPTHNFPTPQLTLHETLEAPADGTASMRAPFESGNSSGAIQNGTEERDPGNKVHTVDNDTAHSTVDPDGQVELEPTDMSDEQIKDSKEASVTVDEQDRRAEQGEAAKQDVNPPEMLEKAQSIMSRAEAILADAEKFSASADVMSRDFIESAIPVDQEDGHFVYCIMCGLSGDLLCCDGCPNVVHSRCVGLAEVPEGEWYCEECVIKGKSATPQAQNIASSQAKEVSQCAKMDDEVEGRLPFGRSEFDPEVVSELNILVEDLLKANPERKKSSVGHNTSGGGCQAPFDVLSSTTKEFLTSIGINTAQNFIATRTSEVGKAFREWRETRGMGEMKNNGEVASVSTWKRACRDAAEEMGVNLDHKGSVEEDAESSEEEQGEDSEPEDDWSKRPKRDTSTRGRSLADLDDPIDALSAMAKEFFKSIGVKTADEIMDMKTSEVAKKFGKWRKRKKLPKLKGSGEVATISAWKTACRSASEAMEREPDNEKSTESDKKKSPEKAVSARSQRAVKRSCSSPVRPASVRSNKRKRTTPQNDPPKKKREIELDRPSGLDLLTKPALDFLRSINISSADHFLSLRTCEVAEDYAKWRHENGLTKLRGSGNGATISAWRSLCKKALQGLPARSQTCESEDEETEEGDDDNLSTTQIQGGGDPGIVADPETQETGISTDFGANNEESAVDVEMKQRDGTPVKGGTNNNSESDAVLSDSRIEGWSPLQNPKAMIENGDDFAVHTATAVEGVEGTC